MQKPCTKITVWWTLFFSNIIRVKLTLAQGQQQPDLDGDLVGLGQERQLRLDYNQSVSSLLQKHPTMTKENT